MSEDDLADLRARLRATQGAPVHHLRFDGEHPGTLPIVLTHGWPSPSVELVTIARRLAPPSQHGGAVADAFTVIVPSLPGYTFSPQRPSLPPDLRTHDIWHRLMHEDLGFDCYAAHGGDLGAGVTPRLTEAYPESLAGIHLLAVAAPEQYDPALLTPDERTYLDESPPVLPRKADISISRAPGRSRSPTL